MSASDRRGLINRGGIVNLADPGRLFQARLA